MEPPVSRTITDAAVEQLVELTYIITYTHDEEPALPINVAVTTSGDV
jgi:hypothetical protein